MTREKAEGEEAQQRTIGVTGQGIDGIDERRGVDLPEQQDEEHEEEAHGDMRLLSERLIVRLPADVHTKAGGQRCQR